MKIQTYLLAYDIADPRRLVRVHRASAGWGIRIQYSVFLVPHSREGIESFLGELRGLIDEGEDDVRLYPLPASVEVTQYGRQGVTEGIELVGGWFGGEPAATLAACRRTR